MEFTGVILYTQNMKVMTEFYRDVLGLTPAPDQPFDPKGFFQFGDPQVSSLSLHRGTKPNGGRAKLSFYVDDLGAVYDRLKAAKLELGAYDPQTRSDSGNLNLKDPEGNRLQIYGRAKLPA